MVHGRFFAFTFFGVFLVVVPMNEGPVLDGIEGLAGVRDLEAFPLCSSIGLGGRGFDEAVRTTEVMSEAGSIMWCREFERD